MDSTIGNAQGWKMYNHQAMGDREVKGFVGNRAERADVPVLSLYGPVHFMPTQIRFSSAHEQNPFSTQHSQLMYDT